MPNKKFLITRPQHDRAVNYLYYWAAEVLHFAKNKSINFSDFKGPKANRKEVSKYLEKQRPKLVIFNGHGTTDTIYGHKDEVLIKNNENENLLKDSITYAIACDAAQKLGKKIIEKGGKAFIGYKGPFGFAHDASRECTPAKDHIAEPFKKISNEINVSLLNAQTVKQAYEKSQQLCSKLINEYAVSDAKSENKHIRFWLFWDKNFQTYLGEEKARI